MCAVCVAGSALSSTKGGLLREVCVGRCVGRVCVCRYECM